jgi:hypothetical protein
VAQHGTPAEERKAKVVAPDSRRPAVPRTRVDASGQLPDLVTGPAQNAWDLN